MSIAPPTVRVALEQNGVRHETLAEEGAYLGELRTKWGGLRVRRPAVITLFWLVGDENMGL